MGIHESPIHQAGFTKNQFVRKTLGRIILDPATDSDVNLTFTPGTL
jgi:hypothetical protein